jgi:branched-chain amino acid transport system ATP-binding protein
MSDGLRLRTLRLERDGRLLLEVDALHVPAGECTVVVGEGDSGKTLLAACIAGAVDRVRGEVRVDGRAIAGPPSSRLRAGLAAVANTPLRLRGISVAEALSLAARDGARVSDVLDRFPLLAARRGLSTDRLSGGEHQALRLACAYVARPDALVLDSPTTGLAAEVVNAVLGLAGDEAARGAAVLWLDQPGAPLPAAPSLTIARGRILSAAAGSRTASTSGSG